MKDWHYIVGAIGFLAFIGFILSRQAVPVTRVAPPTPEVQRRIWEQIEAPPMPTPPVTQPTNACGATEYGYPDFSGTPRAGQPAVDQLDCQNHPPFPGATNFCHDGTCY